MPRGLKFVTGDRELDRALDRFFDNDSTGARAAIRTAARESTKEIVLKDFRAGVPVKSGAWRDSTAVKAVKRSRKKIGSRLVTDRNKLFARRFGGTGDPFVYPGIIEFGSRDKKKKGTRIMRRALYDNDDKVLGYFKRELRIALVKANRL